MAMYDMLHNANAVTFSDIIKRQAAFNANYNLFEVKRKNNSNLYQDRLDFLKEFYKFSKDYNNGYKGTWKQWKVLKNS